SAPCKAAGAAFRWRAARRLERCRALGAPPGLGFFSGRGPLVDLDRRRLALPPHLSRLAAARVRPATQDNYLRALEELRDFVLPCGGLAGRPLPIWEAAIWGQQLVAFIEKHDEGRSRDTALRTLHGLCWGRPDLGPAKGALPLANAAVRGWGRLEPPLSRPPVPQPVAYAIAGLLVSVGKLFFGLAVVTMFECYLRASEMVDLRYFQIIEGIQSLEGVGSRLSFVFSVAELQQPSKTNEVDSSVALDLPRHGWLEWARRQVMRCHRGDPAAKVFDLDYPQLLAEIEAASAAAGASALGVTPHCMRHGGASHDRATRMRSLQEVQRRGFWRCDRSVQRCEKHARIGFEFQKLSEAVRQRVLELAGGARLGHQRVFLELFSGGGNRSSHVRRFGLAVIPVDIEHGPHMDLTKVDVFNHLMGWIDAGLVAIIWSGTPRNGMTRARRAPPGSAMPRALRDASHPT
ncbi:unnamed protein product, partial [Prorocentrum cordatum]